MCALLLSPVPADVLPHAHPFDLPGLRAHLALEGADCVRLARFLKQAQPHLAALVDEFYEELGRHPDPALRRILETVDVIQLRCTQRASLEASLGGGPYDGAYAERQARVGLAHFRVGLRPAWYIGAYHFWQCRLHTLAFELEPDVVEARRTCLAIDRVLCLDMGLVMEAYMRECERILTERNHDLAERNTELRALQQARADHAAMLFHDVAGPLSTLMTCRNLLEGPPGMAPADDPHARPRILAIIKRNQHRIQELLLDVVELHRAEHTDLGIVQTPVAVPPLVDALVASYAVADGTTGPEYTVRYDPETPLAWADEHYVRRVLGNLLDNATKYTPDGGTIHVHVGAGAAGTELCVSVADTGPGIPPADRERIFDQYFSGQMVAADDRTRRRGLGLGLAFCKAAVEEHGGRMWIESTPESGARFCFTLPAAPADSADSATR